MRRLGRYLGAVLFFPCLSPAASAVFSGQNALSHVVALTQFGPRVPGTPEHIRMQKYIQAALESWKLKPELDNFSARTPVGKIPMCNIIARIAGKSDRAVIVAGHYDTKRTPGTRFVGANDGGSSTGFLLELARVLARGPRRDLGVWIAFLDGEEPLAGEWTTADSLYGSKRMAQRLRDSGQAGQVEAVIVVDMIGDRQLDLLRDINSTGWLNSMVREVAAGLGLGHAFGSLSTAIEDDHLPFLAIGLPAVDLIDFNYGPNNSYWHTSKDSSDKLSAKSLETVGRIVLGTIDAIARRR